MSLFPVDGRTAATGGKISLPAPESADIGGELLTEGAALPHAPGGLPSQPQVPCRDQRLCKPISVLGMPQIARGKEARECINDQEEDDGQLANLKQHFPERGLPGVPGMATSTVLSSPEIERNLSRRRRRQLKSALKKSEHHWKSVFNLLCEEDSLQCRSSTLEVCTALQQRTDAGHVPKRPEYHSDAVKQYARSMYVIDLARGQCDRDPSCFGREIGQWKPDCVVVLDCKGQSECLQEIDVACICCSWSEVEERNDMDVETLVFGNIFLRVTCPEIRKACLGAAWPPTMCRAGALCLLRGMLANFYGLDYSNVYQYDFQDLTKNFEEWETIYVENLRTEKADFEILANDLDIEGDGRADPGVPPQEEHQDGELDAERGDEELPDSEEAQQAGRGRDLLQEPGDDELPDSGEAPEAGPGRNLPQERAKCFDVHMKGLDSPIQNASSAF